ncbi:MULTISPECIES: DUF6868 family protein [Alteromonadaceae]|jgi:hypothetical protein|uniref:DUF6868 domain-containing protein n=1 Tax=Brumicola blandensis TaxID=3075611 RepID=A0AAW8QY36_9ALTE|nr:MULTISPECIES: hypothetical protein [unclassified Alteromonas]MDT0581694.1 hypothetical protein [Alteromonas sp. W409]MDT0627269.1 hypothetical protein [Alteromonas sp. W364]
MISANELTTFFGWCTVINIGIYLFSAFFIIVFKRFTINLHSKIVGVEASDLPNMYFAFLGNYKIAILLLNLSPYIALKVMGS